MGSYSRSHLTGTTIGDAYSQTLGYTLRAGFPYEYVTIHVDEPVTSLDHLPTSMKIEDWQENVNAGEALTPFSRYEYYDGTTLYWVNNRIEELFDGMYTVRLTNPVNQLDKIVDRLKQGNHGSCTNALIAQIFQYEPDLRQWFYGVI